MNLFFAYILAVCPALHDVLMILFFASLCLVFLGFIVFCMADNANDLEGEDLGCRTIGLFGIICVVLLLLVAFVPSQKRLDSMLLNYHAVYVACDKNGVCK